MIKLTRSVCVGSLTFAFPCPPLLLVTGDFSIAGGQCTLEEVPVAPYTKNRVVLCTSMLALTIQLRETPGELREHPSPSAGREDEDERMRLTRYSRTCGAPYVFLGAAEPPHFLHTHATRKRCSFPPPTVYCNILHHVRWTGRGLSPLNELSGGSRYVICFTHTEYQARKGGSCHVTYVLRVLNTEYVKYFYLLRTCDETRVEPGTQEVPGFFCQPLSLFSWNELRSNIPSVTRIVCHRCQLSL